MSAREQHAAIAETIAAMKRALKRKSYESDSDSEIELTTNRGNKLKKRARFVRQGKLGPPTGPAIYKEVVEHAGYQRAIISRNPPLIDQDGYDIDSGDDEQDVQDAMASAAEEDPYSSIHLEHLLAPLTSVTDLPTHPTLSRPFTSKALTELATQGRYLMQKENAALWKVRPLLTKLSGDHIWASCDMMLGPKDLEYFDENFLSRFVKHSTKGSQAGERDRTATPQVNGESTAPTLVNGQSSHAAEGPGGDQTQQKSSGEEDVAMTDADKTSQKDAAASKNEDGPVNGDKSSETVLSDPHSSETDGSKTATGEKPDKAGASGDSSSHGDPKQKQKQAENGVDQGGGGGGAETADGGSAPEGAQRDTGKRPEGPPNAGPDARGGSQASPTPSAPDENFIHPIFLAPASAYPDRDLSLPQQEAEDVRRLLQLYVQKQEEVCRGTRRLCEGLLKADRLRKKVLHWSKAEAHAGANRDMSDGEDWYDKEEWGLAEDLKKGQDEEEEVDAAQTQKKTRNRR